MAVVLFAGIDKALSAVNVIALVEPPPPTELITPADTVIVDPSGLTTPNAPVVASGSVSPDCNCCGKPVDPKTNGNRAVTNKLPRKMEQNSS